MKAKKIRKQLRIILMNLVAFLVFTGIATEIGEVAQAQPNPPDNNIEWVADHLEVYPVYPTDSPTKSAQDKSNVQWAVDQGGRILLKAYAKGTTIFTPFFFKQTGFENNPDIVIGNNCVLEGEILKERYPSGEPHLAGQNKMTEIRYGALCFAINTPSAHIGADEVKIRNLVSREAQTHFCGSYQDCDVEIDNVKVVDFIKDPSYSNLIALYSHNNGRWVVRNCTVRQIDSAPGADYGIAYLAFGSPGADLEITDNDVVCQGNGIGAINYGSGNTATIKGNRVECPLHGVEVMKWWIDIGAAYVSHNNVYASDVGIFTIDMHDAVIKSNIVTMSAGIGISMLDSSNNTLQGNKVTGVGLLGALLGGKSTNNGLMGNNFSTFNATNSFGNIVVYFDDGSVFGEPFPQGNSYVGNGGVVNESAKTYNTITGLEPIAGAFNEEDKNAIAEAAQKLSKWPTDEWHPGQPDVQSAPPRRHRVSPNYKFPTTWGWLKK